MWQEHVGKILEQPDRLDHADRLAAPGLEVERTRMRRGLANGRRQLIKFAGDQARAQIDANPGRVHAPLIQPGVDESQLRRRDAQLDVSSHVLPALA